MPTSFRLATTWRPAAGSIATRFGTASTGQPAAVAEAMPVGESSIATHSRRIDTEAAGGAEVRLGVRLAVA